MKNLAILGSTGSIGTQALEVVDCLDNINIVALSANNNVQLFSQQIATGFPVTFHKGLPFSVFLTHNSTPSSKLLAKLFL